MLIRCAITIRVQPMADSSAAIAASVRVSRWLVASSSHLDTLTEAAIAAELSAIGCTRMVIAHRISTVSDADQILVLDHGTITERGDHQELMALGGRYAALVHQQSAPLTGRAA